MRTSVTLLLASAVVVTVLVFLLLPPYPQPQAYHHFADTRAIGPVPNGLNVLSNVAFLIAGLYGLSTIKRGGPAAAVLFLGVMLTAFGSGAYHWLTNDAWLVWDRAGMAVAFAGFFALVIEDRLGEPQRAALPVALAIVNLLTIVLWRVTGDLRAYGIAQFFPLLATIVMCLFLRSRSTHNALLWMTLACYAAAKVCEDGDAAIYRALGNTVSGHTLKHLLGGLGALLLAVWIRKRQPAASLSPARMSSPAR
jgi:hypothetical protein